MYKRIIPKHGHGDWMIRLGKIILECKDGKEPKSPEVLADIEILRGAPMVWSSLHGIGQLTTPFFIILIEVYPPTATEKRLEWSQSSDCPRAEGILTQCLKETN